MDDTLSRSPDDAPRKTHPTLRIRQFETHTQYINTVLY